MAYLTFDPSSPHLENMLAKEQEQIKRVLQTGLVTLGVAEDDVVFKMLKCNTFEVSYPQHIEIILKTDSNRVTAPEIVKMLEPYLSFPFEVTRIYVGYVIPELFHEIWALVRRIRRNWAHG